MKRIFLRTAASLALGTAAFAATDITTLDADGDGMVTMAEMQAAFPEFSDEAFAALDVSGDGMLDADEVAAAVEKGLMPMASDG